MRLALALLACVLALAAWAPAGRAAPPVAWPNPVFTSIRLDYLNPLPGALAPLRPAVAPAAGVDYDRLRYLDPDDLGGFVLAPVGGSALLGLARTLVAGPAAQTPDDGRRPLPGIGVPPPVAPPPNADNVPPANQGFSGRPRRRTPPTKRAEGLPVPERPTPPTTTTPTTTTQTPPPPTTTSITTTTTTITTAGLPPPQPPPPGGGGGAGESETCGTSGLEIVSDQATCGIYAINMAPGDAASEVLTITNTSGAPVTLSLRASGDQNHLWEDLRLGVWEHGTAQPTPLPPLDEWTTQFNDLTTLAPGESVAYVVELYLPTTAGNDDQHLAASIDLAWREQA